MMIQEVTRIGTFHIDHNEDYLLTTEIGDRKTLISVMDGCSMGKDSYFASTLIGKILKNISLELAYMAFIKKEGYEMKLILEMILRKLFLSLKEIRDQLGLEVEELLSTLILGIVDLENKEAEIIVIGDGLVSCNGVLTEYEQDDKPDYLGYHLRENFAEWYQVQSQRLSFREINDLSISTDGIFTFTHFDNKKYPKVNIETLIDYLLNDADGIERKGMLFRKLNFIENNYGLKPTDDLSIIRLGVS